MKESLYEENINRSRKIPINKKRFIGATIGMMVASGVILLTGLQARIEIINTAYTQAILSVIMLPALLISTICGKYCSNISPPLFIALVFLPWALLGGFFGYLFTQSSWRSRIIGNILLTLLLFCLSVLIFVIGSFYENWRKY